MWVRGHARSLKMVPFLQLGYTVFHSPSIVTMAVSLAISEIFSVQEWPDLEIRVWGRSRLFKMARFDRPSVTCCQQRLNTWEEERISRPRTRTCTSTTQRSTCLRHCNDCSRGVSTETLRRKRRRGVAYCRPTASLSTFAVYASCWRTCFYLLHATERDLLATAIFLVCNKTQMCQQR